MREKVTEALVYRLANELLALGINPTNANIRERNGDYGSPNAIQPHLKRWKDEQREKEDKANKPQRPMPDNLNELFMPLWVVLNREADKSHEEEKRKFEVVLLEKEQEVAGLYAALEKADSRNDQLHDDNQVIEENHKKQLSVLEDKLKSNESIISKSQQKQKQAETQRSESLVVVEQQKERIASLEKQLAYFQSLTDQLTRQETEKPVKSKK